MVDVQRRRVIINTDAKNEADDQFAIVHALLTPMFDLRGLIAAHFGTRRTQESMIQSRAEIDLLLQMMDLEGQVTVANGAAHRIPDEQTPVDSDGARLIIEESKHASEDDRLYVAFLGPLTDMASAILLDPQIVHRPVTVIWIGGVAHDGSESRRYPEFNLSNDVDAANVVFSSGIDLWQIPSSIYRLVSASYAELEEEIGHCGELGRYLIDQTIEFNNTHHKGPIESRSLGDSPAVAVMMFPDAGTHRRVPAPRFGAEGHYIPGEGHPMRVYEVFDIRFLMADMFAKIRKFAGVGRR